MSNRQFQIFRNVTGFTFRHFAQRKNYSWKIFSRQVIQNVRLILFYVDTLFQLKSIVFKNYSRIMTGSQIIRTYIFRKFEQLTEFNFFIATHTRIRCPPAQIFGNEIIFNFRAKNFAKIGDVMNNPQLIGYRLSVLNFPWTATTFFVKFFIFKPHSYADNFKTAIK